jgi:alpha-beta hydrolase superfamily lysophospholipase
MSTTNKARDRDRNGRLLRKYRRRYEPHFPNGTPKWWRKLFMTRPRRRQNKHICWLLMHGANADGLIAPVGNCKPHKYYW